MNATAGFFAQDARLLSRAPFPEHGPIQGARPIRRFLRDHLSGEITIDVTRKQVAGDRVTWSARWRPRDSADHLRGEIEATFRNDEVTDLALSGVP